MFGLKLSLQTKVSLFVTLIIVVTSLASAFLFTSTLRSSNEEGMLARGNALSYALAHAAEEGLIREDLDLLKKASDFIKAPDVLLVQVYTDLWEVEERSSRPSIPTFGFCCVPVTARTVSPASTSF